MYLNLLEITVQTKKTTEKFFLRGCGGGRVANMSTFFISFQITPYKKYKKKKNNNKKTTLKKKQKKKTKKKNKKLKMIANGIQFYQSRKTFFWIPSDLFLYESYVCIYVFDCYTNKLCLNQTLLLFSFIEKIRHGISNNLQGVPKYLNVQVNKGPFLSFLLLEPQFLFFMSTLLFRRGLVLENIQKF